MRRGASVARGCNRMGRWSVAWSRRDAWERRPDSSLFFCAQTWAGWWWVANSGLTAFLLDEMWTVCRRLEQLAMPEVAMEAHPTETMSEDALTILQLSSRRKRHPWVLVV